MAEDNNEEYQIMPQKTISKIKKEIENLKTKAASSDEVASPGFKRSIDNLTESINSLMSLFKEAAEEMKVEEKTEENIEQKLGPLVKKVAEIEEENKKIAEGILAVADMVRDLNEKIDKKPALRPEPLFKPKISPPQMEPRGQQFGQPPMPLFAPPREPMPQFMPPRQPQRTLSGGPLPPLPAPRFQQMRPEQPRFEEFPKPKPFPSIEEESLEGMPLPPLPPDEFDEERPKKKGLFGLFNK
jgi:archaellum component FlaC